MTRHGAGPRTSPPVQRRDESGYSLVEMLIALVLLGLVVTSVDASITMLQDRQVQVSATTEALDALMLAEQAITRDVHAATAWTTPPTPAQLPAQPITSTTLQFTASLDNATPTVSIVINDTAHTLTVTSTTGSSTQVQAQVSNVDPSSLFTMTTRQVQTTVGGVTTDTEFLTTVSSQLVVDVPAVGAPHEAQATEAASSIMAYNVEYACQRALQTTGASGSC